VHTVPTMVSSKTAAACVILGLAGEASAFVPNGGLATGVGRATAVQSSGLARFTLPRVEGGAVMMAKKKKQKVKTKGPQLPTRKELDPEMVFFEGKPSPTELIAPTLSIITIIGILPFIASLYRQATVGYKFTNKRLSIASGFQGQEVVEIPWRDVVEVRTLKRMGGACGDIVAFLKDGAKLEVRSIPNWEENLNFIMLMVGPETREQSGFDLPEGYTPSYPEQANQIDEFADMPAAGIVGGAGGMEAVTETEEKAPVA